MAEVIPFPRNEGNGAREALTEYFTRDLWLEYVIASESGPELSAPDHLLTWLWAHGFKVVPVEVCA